MSTMARVKAPLAPQTKQTDPTGTFIHFPRPVGAEFRQTVLCCSPALTEHPDAAVFRLLLEYLLFGPYPDREQSTLMLPYKVIAMCVGLKPNDKRLQSKTWLERFTQAVLPLNVTEYDRRRGTARTVAPEIDPLIRAALEKDRAAQRAHPNRPRVYFHSGLPVTVQRRKQVLDDYDRALIASQPAPPEDHQGRAVYDYLNTASQRALAKLLRCNGAAIEQAVAALAQQAGAERRYDFCRRVLDTLGERTKIRYGFTEKSPRVYARGVSIAMLPRDIRKIALGGCFELDLQYCHLAIIAKIWGIPALQSHLELLLKYERSFWEVMLVEIGLTAASKGIIKKTTYSIPYGMGRRKLRENLANGTEGEAGIGAEKAAAFFSHPLIKALLKARYLERKKIKAAGGACDATRCWIPLKQAPDRAENDGEAPPGKDPVASIMSRVIQSYELLLMASILPVIQKYPGRIHLVLWLHDGVAIYFSDKNPAWCKSRIAEMKEAVNTVAREHRFATVIKEEYLPGKP